MTRIAPPAMSPRFSGVIIRDRLNQTEQPNLSFTIVPDEMMAGVKVGDNVRPSTVADQLTSAVYGIPDVFERERTTYPLVLADKLKRAVTDSSIQFERKATLHHTIDMHHVQERKPSYAKVASQEAAKATGVGADHPKAFVHEFTYPKDVATGVDEVLSLL